MSPSLPTITIVTPNLNHGHFLEATLDSVLGQDYPHLEYLVMDGGSRDESVAVLKRYERHLTAWTSRPDDGQYHAVNQGFANSRGEILAWLNSGDVYVPGALRAVGSMFAELREYDWLAAQHELVLDDAGRSVAMNTLPGYSRAAFSEGRYLGAHDGFGWIPQASTFWRRTLWNRAGPLDAIWPLAADFDLWARFYGKATLVGFDGVLAAFRLHPGQRSDGDAYRREAESVLRHHVKRSGTQDVREVRPSSRRFVGVGRRNPPLSTRRYDAATVVRGELPSERTWTVVTRTIEHRSSS